jgi:hypothetical protein
MTKEFPMTNSECQGVGIVSSFGLRYSLVIQWRCAFCEANPHPDYNRIHALACPNPLAGSAALGYENGDETNRATTPLVVAVRPDFRVGAN